MIAAVLEIADAVTRLAVARGTMLDDVASEVYTDGLRDLSPLLVSQACRELGLEPRADYEPSMPALATIRARVGRLVDEDADAQSRAKLLPFPHAADPDEPVFCCVTCFDEPNAFRILWCAGAGPKRAESMPARVVASGARHCGRQKEHLQHTWADRCLCSDTNPVIQGHRERQRSSVQKRVGR